MASDLIFLSYRRTDAAAPALALKCELENRLRAAPVFVCTLPQSGPRPRAIDAALRQARVVIPVIGKAWAGPRPDGSRAIDDPDDWVRLELRAAVALKRHAIVPVVAEGAQPLRGLDLPADIAALAGMPALALDGDWEASVGRIVGRLVKDFGYSLKDPYKSLPDRPAGDRRLPADLADLASLDGWTVEFCDDPLRLHGKRVGIARTFAFKSFDEAMEFVGLIAAHAEAVQHHPRLTSVWRTLTVSLSTWDAGHQVTARDVAFARYLDAAIRDFDPPEPSAP